MSFFAGSRRRLRLSTAKEEEENGEIPNDKLLRRLPPLLLLSMINMNSTF